VEAQHNATSHTAQEHTVNRTQHQHRRGLPVIATTILVIGLGALPAAARQDQGTAEPTTAATYFCALQRVDTQFVACDELTGNGVPAPAWVDER
jgi:hypothetical protein